VRDLTRTRPAAARSLGPARLEIGIEQLVLEGVEAFDASALESAIALEVGRLLAGEGIAGRETRSPPDVSTTLRSKSRPARRPRWSVRGSLGW
jgi:hypothetical protein